MLFQKQFIANCLEQKGFTYQILNAQTARLYICRFKNKQFCGHNALALLVDTITTSVLTKDKAVKNCYLENQNCDLRLHCQN